MTTQTPQIPQRRRPATKAPDPVPKNLRWLRTLLTFIAGATMFAGVGWTAVALGKDDSYYPPLGVVFTGVVLFVVAVRPTLYLALAGRRARRQAFINDPAAQAALPVQNRRSRGKQSATQQGPDLPEPDESLPIDFRYIVGGSRRMKDELRTSLARTYDTLMAEDADYRGAVMLVRSIAQEWPFPEDEADRVYREPGEDGFEDPRNPGLFLTELDAITGAASAVAALLLVRGDRDATEAVWNIVMAPWLDAQIPFLYGGVKYKAGPDGKIAKVVPKPRPAPAGAAPAVAYAPVQRGRERVDLGLTDAQAAVTPPPVAMPAVPPADPGDSSWVADHLPTAKQEHKVPAPAAAQPSATGSPSPIAAASPVGSPYTVADLAMAADLVVTSQFGSVSMVQRKMRVGFAMAAAMMDRLAVHGIVRPAAQGAAWEVLEPVKAAADIVRWIEENEVTR